jgi:hypothetical protein
VQVFLDTADNPKLALYRVHWDKDQSEPPSAPNNDCNLQPDSHFCQSIHTNGAVSHTKREKLVFHYMLFLLRFHFFLILLN